MARKTVETNISYDPERRRYYVSLDFGLDDDGQRIRKYKTFPGLAQARRALREHQVLRETELWVPPAATTLAEWMNRWMEEVVKPNRAYTTAYSYRKVVENHINPTLGHIQLQRLSPRDIQGYYAHLRELGLSPLTVRRHHDLLSCALRVAVRQQLLSRNPVERVEPPRVVPREAQFYDSDTLKRLYQLVEGHWLEPTVKLAGSLGLRREEICGLRWGSVDFAQSTIRIREARTAAGGTIIRKETKNASSTRTLHMPDQLRSLLRRELLRQEMDSALLGERYQASDYVVVNRYGVPHSPNALSLAFTKFVRANGLPPLTLHGLRHTFATVASAQGTPLFEIGKALGHSTPATTGKIYTHLLDTTHAPTLSRVASALK
jgi:integrase